MKKINKDTQVKNNCHENALARIINSEEATYEPRFKRCGMSHGKIWGESKSTRTTSAKMLW